MFSPASQIVLVLQSCEFLLPLNQRHEEVLKRDTVLILNFNRNVGDVHLGCAIVFHHTDSRLMIMDVIHPVDKVRIFPPSGIIVREFEHPKLSRCPFFLLRINFSLLRFNGIENHLNFILFALVNPSPLLLIVLIHFLNPFPVLVSIETPSSNILDSLAFLVGCLNSASLDE